MEFEPGIKAEVSPIVAHYEPKIIPVVDVKEEVFPDFYNEYYPKRDNELEKLHWRDFTTVGNKYVFVTEISGMRYLFRLSGKKRRR